MTTAEDEKKSARQKVIPSDDRLSPFLRGRSAFWYIRQNTERAPDQALAKHGFRHF